MIVVTIIMYIVLYLSKRAHYAIGITLLYNTIMLKLTTDNIYKIIFKIDNYILYNIYVYFCFTVNDKRKYGPKRTKTRLYF